MTRFLVLVLGAVLTVPALADVSLDLLEGELNGHPASAMMTRFLQIRADAALAQRAERYEALKTPEDIHVYQENLRRFFVERLGGFPDRVPLNARVVGQGILEKCRYEKIIFESLPGFYVTGLLFLPLDEGPWPGVIVPCGHSANGKAAETYQRASMLLAASGMAAFCYDPIGQGERYAYLKADNTPEFGATAEHTLIGIGAILTGTNTAQYRIWDGMRAIDYLQSRDDILQDRIGCTGNSGGGTLTSYLMALDPRIQCAAPACYITSFERLLHTIGPQDAEQNIFGQLAFGMDHADYLHMRAPLPTLICAATRDFFDISGTWDTFREAKRLFTRLGYPERVDLVEHDDTHGFSQPLREGAARWMSRWLLERDCVIVEPKFEILTDEEALCVPGGQVMLLDGAVSPLDLNRAREEQLHAVRAAFRASTDDAAFRERVRELINLGEIPNVCAVTSLGTIDVGGHTVERLLLEPEPGITLPALLALPDPFTGDAILLCHGEGKTAAFESDRIPSLLNDGNAVLVLDVRGVGETANTSGTKGWAGFIGPEWQDIFLAYLVGESYVGMRVRDIVAAADVLADRTGGVPRLIATSQNTVPALHAVALYPERFGHLRLEEGIPSWSDVVREPRAKHQLVNAVHDALSWYDLADLIDLVGEDRIDLVNMFVPVF